MNKAIFLDKDGTLVKRYKYSDPPLAEEILNGVVLFDGIHRNYLCGSIGSTLNTVHISEVDEDLPFSILRWKDAILCNTKPPISERYQGLKKEFFRDLSYVGIDG